MAVVVVRWRWPGGAAVGWLLMRPLAAAVAPTHVLQPTCTSMHERQSKEGLKAARGRSASEDWGQSVLARRGVLLPNPTCTSHSTRNTRNLFRWD